MTSEITDAMVEAALAASVDKRLSTMTNSAAMRFILEAALAAALPQGEDVAGVVELIKSRVDQEFDGEAHFSTGEALSFADLLASLSAKVAEVERERDEARLSAQTIGDQFGQDIDRLTRSLVAGEAERDELRAAIFGGTNYASDLRNGNFVEMARGTERGRRGAVARATAAEARASELQREVERLREAIKDALGRHQITHIHAGLRAALQQEGESDV